GEQGVALPADPTTQTALFALDNAGALNAADFAGSEELVSFGFFQNAFDTRTQGIDVVASTDYSFYGNSNTDFALAFNWTDTEVTDRGLDTAAPLSLGRARQLEENTPATRGNLTINHFHGPFRGLARVNYWGSFFECHLDDVNDDPAQNGCGLPIDAGAQITVDLEAAYEVVEGVQLIAGVQNAFDSFPDENPFAGIVGSLYPATAPGGFSGGLYYFKLRADL
ncbi:MAG: TonB-dependent receptor, partial [Pseudomonadota bacterium]